MRYYSGNINKNNEFRVFAYYNHEGKVIKLGTKLKVTKKQFDPIKNIPLESNLAAVLDKWKAQIKNSIVENERKGKLITPELVKHIIQKVTTNKLLDEDLTIRALYNEYVPTFNLSKKTEKNYRAAYRLFEQFLLMHNSTDIIERYTARDFQLFIKYLRSLQYADNSIKIYVNVIKKIVNKAYIEGRIDNEIGRMMKFRTKNVTKEDFVVFTSEELEQFEGLTLRRHMQWRIDVFLFMCYTGCRFSDYKRFVFEPELCEVSDEQIVISESVKTGKRIFIPNKGHCRGAWRILNKYNGLLPKYKSCDTFSRQLKKDFKFLDHPEHHKLSSHCARKTFTTILLMEQGLEPLIVSKLLTHSDMRLTLRHYEKGNDEHLRKALEKTEKQITTKESTSFLKIV